MPVVSRPANQDSGRFSGLLEHLPRLTALDRGPYTLRGAVRFSVLPLTVADGGTYNDTRSAVRLAFPSLPFTREAGNASRKLFARIKV